MKKKNRNIISLSLTDEAFYHLEGISKSTGLSKSAVVSLFLTYGIVVEGGDKFNTDFGSIAEGPKVTA